MNRLPLIGLTLATTALLTYREFKQSLSAAQLQNQRKMSRIVSQSLDLYFQKLRFAVESAALRPEFQPDRTRLENQLRFNEIAAFSLESTLQKNGIQRILETPRKSIEPKGASASQRPLKNWQIFKALPEFDPKGRLIAADRRTFARNILRNLRDVHYVFEMDSNGDLVFLEPFDIQKNITSFNYEFRDYLQRT
jgi:hypothetical protein